jgi:hypothetical protein
MPANDTLACDLETKGYAVVRDVFTAGEIASLRGIVDRHFAAGKGVGRVVGYVQPNAAIAVPDLAWLWGQDKVVALLRRALNTEDIVFTGHCDVHRDARFRWHKDSGPRAGDYFNGDYFGADDCRVYKLGIYLEDHVGGDCGLKVSPASHRSPAMSAQPPVSLDTRAGDVVLFDVRLSHCGQVPDLVERGLSLTSRLLGVSQGAPGSKFFSRVHARYLRALRRRPRQSVFFAYGWPNQFTQDYARGSMSRQHRQTGARETRLPEQLISALAARDVKLADVLTTSDRDTASSP